LEKLLEKLDEFLFDILGLLAPGLISLLLFLSPQLFIYSVNNSTEPLSKYLIKLANYLSEHTVLWASFLLLICYILGHTIKVFSKYPYKLFSIVIDEGILKIICLLRYKLEVKVKEMDDSKLNLRLNSLLFIIDPNYRKKCYFVGLINEKSFYGILLEFIVSTIDFILQIFSDVFVFETKKYMIVNQDIEKNVLQKIRAKYNFDYPDKWLSIYRLSNIILDQKNITTLSARYLAKYNFYRSLSFIFMLNFGYIYYIYKLYNLDSYISIYLIMIINFILWLTFHEKFKRYWMLSGNETLLNIFYYLHENN
jgi:hypothetical protein